MVPPKKTENLDCIEGRAKFWWRIDAEPVRGASRVVVEIQAWAASKTEAMGIT